MSKINLETNLEPSKQLKLALIMLLYLCILIEQGFLVFVWSTLHVYPISDLCISSGCAPGRGTRVEGACCPLAASALTAPGGRHRPRQHRAM